MLRIFQNILNNLKGLKGINRNYKMNNDLPERLRSPIVNVDGTPMIGSYDLHGRSFGSTDGFGSSKF